ncbi:hypothetical protein [endosymbiont GvMRE of Glomus versiforme]|uniref:hypothetical protein n=1 Tax=endosymbiont GvMRE of Glomus versiforme TaxID=2039283 RepID=UPI000EE1A2FE|nr:hypothetical protein [endosymbiont GvMRE of Glomus versiforme]RHZ36367.1 hypothetical protein GvMRE_Ic1g169 [endosymbiont GvMRE of Glomus versiforme]
MELEQLSKYLEEIIQKIRKLELQEKKEDKRNRKTKTVWPDKKTCQQREIAWHGLQKNILIRLDSVKIKSSINTSIGKRKRRSFNYMKRICHLFSESRG